MVKASSYSLFVLFLLIALNNGSDGLELSLSLFELVFHTSPDTVEDLASLMIGLLGGLAIFLDVSLSCLGSFLLLLLLIGASNLVEGVESVHEGMIVERVLLGDVLDDGSLNLAELGLNLVRVDDSSEISDGHLASVELISTLLNTLLSVGSEDLVEVGEGVLGEDDESAEVSTWGELKQVQSVDAASVNTWEVSGGSLEEGVLISVNKERSLSQNETRISHFVLTSTGGSALANSFKIT